MTRERLPNRRACDSFEFTHACIPYIVSVSRYPDGSLGELFLRTTKAGSAADTNARDAAIVFSLALQFGADAEAIRHALCRDANGAALGPLGQALDRVLLAQGAP
jgi:hypothetical protein